MQINWDIKFVPKQNLKVVLVYLIGVVPSPESTVPPQWAKKRWADFLLTEWLGARPGLLENKSRMVGSYTN